MKIHMSTVLAHTGSLGSLKCSILLLDLIFWAFRNYNLLLAKPQIKKIAYYGLF